MIVFADSNYLGSLPTSNIVIKSYILHVRRVQHPPLNEIHVTHNLMQDSRRDFSISNMNIVRTPLPPPLSAGGFKTPTKISKKEGGLNRTSTFIEGFFFWGGGGVQFSHKK